MADEWKKYVEDSRTVCKYGSKCYQKNEQHHKTFKHPPQVTKRRKEETVKGNSKRIKIDDTAKHETRESNKDDNFEISGDVKESKINSIAFKEKEHMCEEANCTHLLKIKITKMYNKSTDRNILKELFLVEMPTDFYHFFECLEKENDSVQDVLNPVNLQLIGPYELLLGKLPMIDKKELYLIHWRFFYDPPEFQAVLKMNGKSEYHIGYYRDDPAALPVFLASNDSAKDYHITPMAENIFGAVYIYLQNQKKKSPFTSMACQRMMDKIRKWAEEYNYSLEGFEMKKRLAQMITRTFHGAGIVVPYNKKTQLGYRPLVETDANIKKLFSKLEKAETESEKDKVLSELQPIITYANIAVDECDFGTGLELGIALFCSGFKELHVNAVNTFCSAYTLLNREAFGKIIQEHLKYRRKGPAMSINDLCLKE